VARDLVWGTIGIATPTDPRISEAATVSPESLLTGIVAGAAKLPSSQWRRLAVLVAAALHTARP
jgi:hypothetical protein